MGSPMMETRTKRGAAAALFAIVLGAPLGAQVAAGAVRLRTPEGHDSAEIRAVMMTRERLDSITALFRELRTLQPGTSDYATMKARIEALMPTLPSSVVIRSNAGGFSSAFPKGWIGINEQGPKNVMVGPTGYFVQYFDYPSIISVDPESPAQRAGILPGDVLVGYDGVDIRGHRFDMTQVLVPDKKLSVLVRRDGETKDYTVTVAPAPAQVFERRLSTGRGEIRVERLATPGDGPPGVVLEPSRVVAAGGARGVGGGTPFRMTYVITPNGAFGAVMSTVGPELAKALKLETGVLVTDITDETPASRSGLRSGDVIVNVSGQPVSTLRALQETIARRAADHSAVLQIIRDRQPQKLTVSW